MLCQECNERPATLHLTKIINGEKTILHLCEKCAQEKGDVFMMQSSGGFSINNLLAGLLNMESAFHPAQKTQFYQQNSSHCENCSMTYQQFVQIGHFGCPHCYEAFKDHLKPLLRRLHSGSLTHNGKIPKRMGGSIHIRKSIDELKLVLKEAIIREEFEKAAEIRDQIKYLESQLEEDLNEGGD